MTVLRIMVAFLVVAGFWTWIVPATPSLLGGRDIQPIERAERSVPALPSVAPPTKPDTPVVVRASVAQPDVTEPLKRVAAVSSGAAQPADPATTVIAAAPKAADTRQFNRPIAVDAVTLKTGTDTIRIAGVEVVPSERQCREGAQSWPCAVRARTAFRAWLRGRSIVCRVPADQMSNSEFTTSCSAGDEDIGTWLTANGWAIASTADSRYAEDERQAQEQRRGVWAFGPGG